MKKNPIGLFESFASAKEPLALATIFAAETGIAEKLLITNSNEISIGFNNSQLEAVVRKDLLQLFLSKKSEAKKYRVDTSDVEVFIELIQPIISVILFGGGFDARPVSQLAKSLGWDVIVTDECVAHIAPVFFPAADKLSLCHREFIEQELEITPYTACVLMSHNYEYDRDVLRKIIKTETPYIGILGPRKRFDKMVEEFAKKNIELQSDDNHRIHSPIGLDIGAETPDEIALSIVAEIQSKMANRSGGFLKYRSGPIHQRDTASDQVFKQVYLAIPNKASAQ